MILSKQLIIVSYFSKNKVEEIANAGDWLHAENLEYFYTEVTTFLG